MENTAQPIQQPVAPAPSPQQVAPAQPKAGWMPKKTMILIILLAVVTVILLVVALNIKTQPSQTVNKPAVSHAYTTLGLAQPIASNSAYQSDIMISTNSNKVTAVQLELSYDSKVVAITDIVPGNFFKMPDILFKKIDPEAGTVTYALGIGLGQKAVEGKGVIATIKLAPLTDQEVNIKLLPQTLVAAQGETRSVLKSSSGLKFSLTSPTPTE